MFRYVPSVAYTTAAVIHKQSPRNIPEGYVNGTRPCTEINGAWCAGWSSAPTVQPPPAVESFISPRPWGPSRANGQQRIPLGV
jgi:hypothetical protein